MIKNKFVSIVLSLLLLGMADAHGTQPTDASLYQVPLKWKNHEGKSMSLSELKGRKVVISMIYASCQTACPLILKKVKAVKTELDRRGTKADYVMVSFDSEGDGPEKLKHFRRHNGVDDPAWTFLVGNAKDTRTLSMLLGIKYSKNPENGQIMHDNKILLLDESGTIVRILEGLATGLDELY